MPKFVQNWVEAEAHKHPAFILFCIISFGVGGGMLANPFVMAGDFQRFQDGANTRLDSLEVSVGGLEKAMGCLQYTTDRNAIEYQLRSVSSEIFQLERVIDAGDGTDRDIGRLDDLRNDKHSLSLELQAIVNRDGCNGE